MKKYYIGYIFNHGGIIVDGPQINIGKNNKKYWKWKVRCPNCNIDTWKFSNTLVGLKYPCKRCYDNSMKIFNESPAIKKAFLSLKNNAKARNIDVQITEKQFYNIAKNSCAYCGAEPIEKTPPKEWQKTTFLNGVDRINNAIGYTIENCAPCCEQCNWAKKDLTIQEWNNWIDMLIKNRNKR